MPRKQAFKRFFTFFSCLLCLKGYAQFSQMGHGDGGNSIIYSTDEVNSLSDTLALFTVSDIHIEGNKKTKEKIILRELSFEKGEQYPLNELVAKFTKTKERLLNTSLFQTVVVSLKSLNGYDATVNIAVTERWYIFPIPFIDVVDRSFQHWMKNEGMDLNRVKYGIKTTHKNLTGRNDRLTFNLTNGYTKKLSFRYDGLQLDHRLKWTAGFSTAYGKNREIGYATINNMGVGYRNPDRFVHTYFGASADVTYRPAIKTRHSFSLGYNNERILDTIAKASELFPGQRNRISYAEASYRLHYADADFLPYPTRGYVAEFLLEKKGFGGDINLWQATAKASASWPLSLKSFMNLRMTGMVKLPFEQPYKMKGFVGGKNMYIQGYEDYVIDGVAGGFTKLTFARQFLNTSVRIPSQRIKRLNHIPVKVYGKVFTNAGYIYNEPHENFNSLNNQFLYSGGIGLDIVLFYDFTLKVEWSLNHLGQNGIYLHDRNYL